MEPFIGQIMLWAGNFAPRGWAFCYGQLLPISSNTALFSLLGTTYGGDGRTTFALPDLRGRVAVGAGTGPGLSTRVLGRGIGYETTSLSVANMPNHTHIAYLKGCSDNANTNDVEGAALASGGRDHEYLIHTPDKTMHAGSVTVSNEGGNIPFNNVQPSLPLSYVIALQGIFPSRS
ncbi:tail fiber protein [Halosquirtibacter xylanolyticus]|uniref:phage tail protein n=1 Tax=Halosquirtibacter xylanolyticus TaxID=3374599 RepID=UPI00374A35D4|nr:tail fiber protein [Prolixibacteraceae bacterium]